LYLKNKYSATEARGSDPMAYHYLERLENAVKQHESWRLNECLNLIASENHSSQEVRSMLVTDLGNRYTSTDKFYRGTKFMDEVQALAEEVARKVFNARFADVRALSGHVAGLGVCLSLLKKGDKVLSVSPQNGGYPGISHLGLGKLMELKNIYFPFDDDAFNIIPKETKKLISAEKPKLIVFGSSFIPFPHPVREISNAAVGSTCIYDGAHVLGLIAGGEFQDPLREGCSLLIGSTHKSFPGPQGGLILSNNEEVFRKVSNHLHPGVVDNIHWNRVAALALTLMELMQFGKIYAQAVIKNSGALGKSLAGYGVGVKGASSGYSKSHQVFLDYDGKKCEFYAKRLEESNIIIDNGGRIGVSEVTRLGMGTGEMEQIGELMSLVILGKKAPDIVQKRVKSLVKDFKEPRYVLRAAQSVRV
jgi:glycine hydroxymethyltransferase